MQIKKLTESETAEALRLVWDVFMKFVAPDYCEKGINIFKSFIDNEKSISGLAIYGAFDEEKIVGVAATRNEGNHIALFFVNSNYHRRDIGRKLFETVLQNSTSVHITVNSSPCAAEVYRHLGFADTDTEQLKNGMRYTPMLYIKYAAV